MKIIASIVLAALTAVSTLSAQAAPAGNGAGEPQLAYRILMGYIQERETVAATMRPIAGWTLVGVGATAVAAGVTFGTTGDLATNTLGLAPLDARTKGWTTFGLVAGGALAAGAGTLLLTTPPEDFRLRFHDVLTAEDPRAQNQLAAATIRTLAAEGANRRTISGIVGIVTPLVTMGITAGINVQNNKPWSDNIISINSSQILGVLGGVSQLLVPSNEERLLEKYEAALAESRN